MASCCSSPLPPSPACVWIPTFQHPRLQGWLQTLWLIVPCPCPLPPASSTSLPPPNLPPSNVSVSFCPSVISLCPLPPYSLPFISTPHSVLGGSSLSTLWPGPGRGPCTTTTTTPSVPMNDTSDSLWLPGWQHRVGASFAASLLILVSLSPPHPQILPVTFQPLPVLSLLPGPLKVHLCILHLRSPPTCLLPFPAFTPILLQASCQPSPASLPLLLPTPPFSELPPPTHPSLLVLPATSTFQARCPVESECVCCLGCLKSGCDSQGDHMGLGPPPLDPEQTGCHWGPRALVGWIEEPACPCRVCLAQFHPPRTPNLCLLPATFISVSGWLPLR